MLLGSLAPSWFEEAGENCFCADKSWPGLSKSSLAPVWGTNVLWAYSVFSERLGINQQGKRLEILTGRRRKQEPLEVASILKAGGAVFVASFICLSNRWVDVLPTFLPGGWFRPINLALSLNFGFFAGILGVWLSKTKFRFALRKRDELPPMPVLVNGIVLGTIGEDEHGLG